MDTAFDAKRIAEEWEAFADRLTRQDIPDEVAARGRVLADAIGRAVEEAAERAGTAWRETRPVRRDMAKTLERQGRGLGRWSRDVWRHDLRPGLRHAWNRRTVAFGAVGAAVPAGRQIIEDATSELGRRGRSERHWGAFVAGMLAGAVVGAVIALLTAPKSGQATRDEIASRAKDAADAASEWVAISLPSGNGTAGEEAATAISEVETES
jgi:hypothetical protein